ncbi:MAG: hypothetical protein AAB613_02770 [Patescibacteria group bacterium]
MDEELLEKIQKSVTDLLQTLSDDLQIAAKDRCSEVARLAGCWILNENPEYKIQICKGRLSDELSHDILIAEKDNSLFLIDPTIWQIFPESKSILIGSSQNVSGAINTLKEKYGGTWKISESLEKCNEKYQQELLGIIKSNG